MGKKKHKKDTPSQRELKEYIFVDNMYQQEMSSSDEFRSRLKLLSDNDLAVSTYVYGYRVSVDRATPYSIACKYMTDINPELKKHITNTDSPSIMIDGSVDESDELKKIRKLSDTTLDNGMYFVELGKCNYAILDIYSPDECDYYAEGYIYFIGEKRFKYKKKFDKFCKKYIDLNDKIRSYQYIITPYGKYTKTRFKPMTNLIFKDKDRVLKYIDNFVNNIPRYYQYGVTPKLSVLLYGKPGTGKSTFYKALADYLDINTIIQIPPEYFTSGDNDSSNRNINNRRDVGSDIKKDSMIAIDEIDCICESRDRNDNDDMKNGHILSDLLSFLDEPPTFSFKAKDGKYYPISIVVATTNYYDRLDPAVKRFGRFDLTLEMVDFTKKEAEEMCALYDIELKDIVSDKYKIDDKFTISPAELQALCMENIDKSLKGQDEKHEKKNCKN